MGIRGTGRSTRDGYLEEVRERDPELAAELEALRTRHPQQYRKKLRALGRLENRRVPTGGIRINLGPTPGRATDPQLRVGAPDTLEAEDARAVATIQQVQNEATTVQAAPEPPAPAEPAPEAAPPVSDDKPKRKRKK